MGSAGKKTVGIGHDILGIPGALRAAKERSATPYTKASAALTILATWNRRHADEPRQGAPVADADVKLEVVADTYRLGAAIIASWGESLSVNDFVQIAFFCDCNALLELGRPLTNLTYIATSVGVVIEDEESFAAGAVAAAKRGDLNEPLSEEKLRLVIEVKKLWDKKRLVLLESPAWQLARQAGEQEKSATMDLGLGMQQFIADDPWLDKPLTDKEQRDFAKAERATAVDWD